MVGGGQGGPAGRAWRQSEGPPRARAGRTFSCLSLSVAGSSACWCFQKHFELSHRLFFKSGVLGTVSRRKSCLDQSIHVLLIPFGLPTWQVKNLPAMHKVQVRTLGPEDPLGKEVLPTPVAFPLPGKCRGQRRLAACGPRESPPHRTRPGD